MNAAGGFQIKGQGKKSYRNEVKGSVLIEPECIPHNQTEYAIDSRPVRIKATQGRIVRHRPWLKKWTLSFEIVILDDDALPFEVMNAIMTTAGQKIGIGDYRPRYGRFIITKFERIAE